MCRIILFCGVLLFFSCNADRSDEVVEESNNNSPSMGLLSWEILDASTYHTANLVSCGNPSGGVHFDFSSNRFRGGKGIFTSYSDLTLRHYYGVNTPEYKLEFSEGESGVVDRMVINYMVNESKGLSDVYGKMEYGYMMLSAFIADDVTLTCDKVLFGENPGSNLVGRMKMLVPNNSLIPVGKDNRGAVFPNVETLDFAPSSVFTTDARASMVYVLRFAEEPEERYDELTFTMTIPLLVEDVRLSMYNRNRGITDTITTYKVTTTADCKVTFDWE